MKKVILLLFIGVGLLSCSQTINMADEKVIVDDDYIPNGNVLSNEEKQIINDISKKYGINTNSRSCSNKSHDDIEEMINILHKELGDEANRYYGESIIAEERIPILSTERALEVPLSDYSVIGWIDSTVTKHWGAWWCYLEYEARIVCRERYYNVFKNIAIDSASCEYEDSETDRFLTVFDWTYLDNPANISSGFYEEIEWEVAVANRGIVHVEGDTKYGFFPSVSDMRCHVAFYDTLISGGKYSYVSTY